MVKTTNKIQSIFLNDRFILFLVIINSLTIFSEGFNDINKQIIYIISFIDSLITVLFILEASIKIHFYGWKTYIQSNWNKLDFILVILSLPSIFLIFLNIDYANLSFLLIFRISRIFKFFRFFKFIPGIEQLIKDIQRALKTSIFILFSFLVYNFIVSVLSCYLYKDISPELFGNPAKSFYSIFKVFTVEGWYEIPDKLVEKQSVLSSFLIKSYFILILFSGGIIGLSLVNSIFVDSMVSDNNDALEKKVDELSNKIEKLIEIQKNNTKNP